MLNNLGENMYLWIAVGVIAVIAIAYLVSCKCK